LSPDYDIRVYLFGFLAAAACGLISCRLWRLLYRRPNPKGGRAIRTLLDAQGFVALACVLVASCDPNDRVLNVATGALALAVAIGAWAYLDVLLKIVERYSSRLPGPTDALNGALLPAEGPDKYSTIPTWMRLAAVDALASAAICLLIYVPDAPRLVELNWLADNFQHWNYFAMAPALELRHRGALGSEYYCQYGVGWAATFALLGSLTPLTYELILKTAVIIGCAYFIELYFFLRYLTGRRTWAFFGVLLAFWLELLCGAYRDFPNWLFPSSTVLRTPWDLSLYWACLAHLRRGGRNWGWLIGSLAGLSVLFGTDTGVYTLAALAVYCLFATRPQSSAAAESGVRFIATTAFSLFSVAALGLSICSRWTMLRPEFLSGYFESLLLFGEGFGSLPMRSGMAHPMDFILTMTVLTLYTSTLVLSSDRFLNGDIAANDPVLAQIAVLGLGELLLFINRSDASNLYHGLVPFCILAADALASTADSIKRSGGKSPRHRDVKSNLLTWTSLVLVFAAALTKSAYEHYPSVPMSSLQKPIDMNGRDSYAAVRRDKLRPIAEKLRSLSEGGSKSVALISEDFVLSDATIFAEADVGPYFRYSPMVLVHRGQFESIRRKFRQSPPDVVMFVLPTRSDTRDLWIPILEAEYEVESEVPDWVVLRRRKS
jgi:hypothetical protein